MTVKIGAATNADAAQIAALWSSFIRDTDFTFTSDEKSEADIRTLLAEKATSGHGVFVARDETRLLGFSAYGQLRVGVGYARTMENTIYVTSTGQGLGVGRALMAAAEDHARERGAHSMWAAITSTNQAAIGFHGRLGYVQMANLPEVGFKWGEPKDLVLMRKRL
ncbi:MAG: N-acetyltransferase family protein [Pseudomonadota bacterium]